MGQAPVEPDPLVVGVDGSDSALRAVRWGALGARSSVSLRLVHTPWCAHLQGRRRGG
ncbi:MAG TPA: hypothetical protein VFQ77_05385 [Pseudonocardiaceae bacterium]|jgi:hypothetical protein|nr:hypothetical protein [Pseudonocardiaceae bacterium]